MNKDDIKLAFTYVGALVGAGFASGQELVRFFVRFGTYGLWGIVFAGISFALMGALVILLTNKIQANDYSMLLRTAFPKKIYKVIDIIIAFSLWVGLGIMLTGSSTLIKE